MVKDRLKDTNERLIFVVPDRSAQRCRWLQRCGGASWYGDVHLNGLDISVNVHLNSFIDSRFRWLMSPSMCMSSGIYQLGIELQSENTKEPLDSTVRKLHELRVPAISTNHFILKCTTTIIENKQNNPNTRQLGLATFNRCRRKVIVWPA
jgi:hypothetical protein